MENIPATTTDQPFARMLATQQGMNVGAVAIEQERAIAEAQGKLTLAKRFPRSMTAAMTDFLEACNNQDFAKTAFYAVKNRGSGPSIRFAEEAARCYGNFDFGHRELSRSETKTEVLIYAWDMEKNNFSTRQITVMHILDTGDGPRKLTNQTDIDNRIANVASKQMRGRILALMPKHMIAAGVAAAKRALAGDGEKPLSERIVAMAQAFARFGVTKAHLQAHLAHEIDHTTVDELADLMGIFNALKEGAKASEYFPLGDAAAEANASTAAAIAGQAQAGKATTSAPPPAAAARRQAAKPPSDTAAATPPAESKQVPATEPTQIKGAAAESHKDGPAANGEKEDPQAQDAIDDVF